MSLPDTLLYVAADSRSSGVGQPGVPGKRCIDRKCTHHTTDWRAKPGTVDNTHGVVAAYAPTTLTELRDRHYRTEAHYVAYEVFLAATGEAIGRQPRVRKDGMAWLRAEGLDVRLNALTADVDTPGHVPWTNDLLAEFNAMWALRAGPLATCGLYFSPKGYRLIQPLRTKLRAEEGERALKAWIERLVAVGVWSNVREVRDWTRHMRTPHHLRNGVAIIAPRQDWDSCEAIDAEVPDDDAKLPVKKRIGSSQPRAVASFDETCPAGWEPVADAVGEAIRDHVRSDWRRCYLALSGALVERGCPPEGVPALIGRAHLVDPQWADLLGDRVTIAQTTILRWGAGLEVSGSSALRSGWPRVSEALNEATSSGTEASVLRQLQSVERRITDVSEATSTLRREIRDAYGVVLLSGPPGLGKTEAVIDHAKGLKLIEGRASPGQRIALSAPTTALAQEIQVRANVGGVRTLRVFGSLSHKGANDEYTCIHRGVAAPLVDGGQSLERLFCEPERGGPCERAQSCPARSGLDGDLQANLVVGPHELLGSLATYAGKGGTIVIDEPPPLVQVTAITADELEAALAESESFEKSYFDRMAPVVHAVVAWARTTVPGAVCTAAEAVRAGIEAVPAEFRPAARDGSPDGIAAEAVRRAQIATGEARSIAPPMTMVAAISARWNIDRATAIGKASAAFLGLYRALQPPQEGLHPVRLRVVERDATRIVSLVGANELVVETLRRDAPTVLLDAGASLIAPTVERIVGHPPRLVELDVSDGAPVSRTVLATGRATRSRMMPRGQIDLDAVVPLLRATFAWAKEKPTTQTLVIVSWAAIEALLMACLDDPTGAARVRRATIPAKTLSEARKRLEDVLAPWRGRVRCAHFGGLRGLDHLRDADALATVGDPRPTIDAEADRCAWLEVDPDGRIEALAAAEEDQAHGRLRLVHRDKPARALHVGSIVPAGWRGREVEVRRMAVGRPKTVASAALTGEDLLRLRTEKGLSLRALSLRTGVSLNALARYERGERAIPETVAAEVLAALQW
jgi:hypothetical protein